MLKLILNFIILLAGFSDEFLSPLAASLLGRYRMSNSPTANLSIFAIKAGRYFGVGLWFSAIKVVAAGRFLCELVDYGQDVLKEVVVRWLVGCLV